MTPMQLLDFQRLCVGIQQPQMQITKTSGRASNSWTCTTLLESLPLCIKILKLSFTLSLREKKNSMCVTIGGINNSIMHTPTPYQIVFCGFEKEREMGVLQRPILCLQITLQVGLVQRQIFMLQHIPTTRWCNYLSLLVLLHTVSSDAIVVFTSMFQSVSIWFFLFLIYFGCMQ